ncbi:hypothetical protein Patl1_16643 [Pistacia atlantica]|uniref:Uncharacterized protein n=1 Tax=Pistacia atlantica TaxID=434234 RepID=A0ACC1B7V8_9ROSI|nr:hypothetical protein Patl1_16643 [Pistacia atlantica]
MAKTDTKTSNKKSKKKKNAGPKSVAMKNKASNAKNPFETIWSRRKFDILGKKRKGEEVRIGLSRSLAIQKRTKTLLKEYEQSGKSSVFVDKRIGERKDELGEFDKAIMRSQRQRQLKLSKKNKYNLSDEEEDELEISGFGPFSERDDFEDEMISDDDNDDDGDGENKKSSNVLKQLNSHNNTHDPVEREFNGRRGKYHFQSCSLSLQFLIGWYMNLDIDTKEMIFLLQKHKSKKEIMEEVILKSKYFKVAQKAKHKEENEQLMEELDKNFSSLVQSQVLLSMTEPSKMNALKALVSKDIPNEHAKLDGQKIDTLNQEQPDSYDKLVKEMALDMRARPSDRTKTDEEIAQEERERLERLEVSCTALKLTSQFQEERRKRMLATDDTSDEDNEADEKLSAQRPKSMSGDDLGDSFSLDEEPKAKRGWVDEVLERKDTTEIEDDDSSEDSDDAESDGVDEGFNEDSDASEKTQTLKDWEQSDDDDLERDLEEEEEEELELDEENDDSDDDEEEIEPRGKKKSRGNAHGEIRKSDKESLDIKKMKVNHTKLSGQPDIPYIIEAPKSLDEFCALLDNCSNADKILVINRIRASNAIKLAAENRKKMQVFYGVLLQYFAVLPNKKPLNFELLNLLVKPLMEMSVEIPYFAAICARQRILRTRTQFCDAIKHPENSCWPSLKTLILLRLWSMIFPCSDFRHVVMTPAILLMCEYLMRCPIVSGQDIAVGSFLCSMILNVSRQSKKFCPEVIIFLRTVLMAATERKQTSHQESEFYHLMDLKALRPLLCIRGCVDDVSPMNFLTIMDMPEDSSFFSSDNFRASVLLTVIETLRGFVNVYEGLSSFPEIFLPIAILLHEVAQVDNMPSTLQEKIEDVSLLIKKKADEHSMLRRPLQMRKKKPVPIKLLNPKFEEKAEIMIQIVNGLRQESWKKLVKREAKGAARELRKDNYFLSQVKEREKAKLEEERNEKYGKARAFLQEQEHAFKSGQLGRGRKRRK